MEEVDLKNWPPIDGRYEVGNKIMPVAICTNASIGEIKVDLNKVAIIGKCVTENIGIEKIIQNVVSNSYIRYLILCGRESKGHFVSQAIEMLIQNGIDNDKRIIGAKGNMPFLRGIENILIERFRKQIIPIDLMPETDSQKIMNLVNDCLNKKNARPLKEAIKIKEIKEIEAKACPKWIPDPKGFFVISVDKNKKKILVEHFDKNNKLNEKIVGDCAEEISKTITNLDLIGDFKQTKEHSMYLGRELQKAEIALKNNLDFEQDKDLIISKVEKQDKLIDEYDWYD
mgnify:FL=1